MGGVEEERPLLRPPTGGYSFLGEGVRGGGEEVRRGEVKRGGEGMG